MSSLDLTLKPAQLEMIAKPGASFTQAYEVTNNSDSSIPVSTSVLPWLPVGSDGSLTYDNVFPNPDFSFSLNNSDLQLGQTFLLHPHETRQLVLKVKSDPSTPLADSYFTFFVSQDLTNTLNPDSDFAAASGRLGSHLLISTSANQSPSSRASITSFKVSPDLKDIFFGNLQFQAKVQNLSGYFFKTAGKLTITKDNLPIKEFDLFPQNVLADSSRSVSCNSNNLPVPCTLNAPLWPGKYVATLSFDPSQVSASASVSFYVFPYSFLLLILFFAILFFSFTRFFKPKDPTLSHTPSITPQP
jgi:hypothetical protein